MNTYEELTKATLMAYTELELTVRGLYDIILVSDGNLCNVLHVHANHLKNAMRILKEANQQSSCLTYVII